jgi:hypothetical protein
MRPCSTRDPVSLDILDERGRIRGTAGNGSDLHAGIVMAFAMRPMGTPVHEKAVGDLAEQTRHEPGWRAAAG